MRITSVDVLLAEDDPDLRQSFRFLLEGHGLTCAEATDGSGVIELGQNHRPRFVLLDIGLPDMDGFTVARKLRADPRTCRAHIHCVTGLRDDRSRLRARLSGCEQYLTKPVAPEVLVEIIHPPQGAGEPGALTCGSLAEAEDLLDWLENQGCMSLRVNVDADGVHIRCVCPPGLRLIRDHTGIPCLIQV
jgi:CheY-like chemotaxis protein